MCVPENSVDLYTSTCPMCKFFRNQARCPHKRETCRNRVNHPRYDVRYIVNAEVTTFKGCGYCKWATQTNPPPPPNKSGMLNPGWQGCCRPPQPHELDKVPPADWPAVNAVHRTPIPSDIKQLLDSLKQSSGSPTLSPASPTSGSYLKDVSNKAAAERDRERKNGQQRMSGSPSGTLRTLGQKTRPAVSMNGGGGSSPQAKQSRLGGSGTPPAGSIVSPTDGPNSNTISVRKTGHAAEAHIPLTRIEGFRTTPPGATRKLCLEGDHQPHHVVEGSRERSATVTRPPIKDSGRTSTRTSPTLEPSLPAQQPQLKRRDSAVKTSPVTAKSTTSLSKASAKPMNDVVSKGIDRDREFGRERERERDGAAGLEKGVKALKISTNTTPVPAPPSAVSSNGSDTSSDNGSRSSEGTVTSDGGFTDYLSDESDAELQRQAEIKAAILEQNRAEENEFRLARKQLASIDLKPPTAWTTGVPRKVINPGYVRGN